MSTEPALFGEPTCCVYDKGIFTGERVLVRGEPIWPSRLQALAGEVILVYEHPKGGLEDVRGQGAGAGR